MMIDEFPHRHNLDGSHNSICQRQPVELRLVSHDGFSARFTDCDFAATPDIIDSYKLEGCEGQWRQVETGERSATYTNLPTGHYVLHVRA